MMLNNPDALPQPMGEFSPVDEWQARISRVFYGLRGGRVQDYSQTFASADYRLAHALAQDYYDRVVKREQAIGNRLWVSGHGRFFPIAYRPSPIAFHAFIVFILSVNFRNSLLKSI